MKNQRKFRFPILLKVILLGVITSFVASAVSIVVNYRNTIDKATKELDESANDALEFSYDFFSSGKSGKDKNIEAFTYVSDYVTKAYINSTEMQSAELKNYPDFFAYEDVFKQTVPYFFADGMFMTQDYPVFYDEYLRVSQVLFTASFYSDQVAYYAIKDPTNSNRFIFLFDSRVSSSKNRGTYYHCPGSHYDIKSTDQIIDLGHEYIKGYKLSKYNTRFIEIKADNDQGGEDVIGYLFVEYDTSSIANNYRPFLINEIIIVSATSFAVILLYAILSYFMFVRNINRLNKAALDISSQLEENKPFVVVEPKVKSHDEMKTLSDSFIAMENQITNYVEVIKADAREKEKINADLEIASKIQLEALPNPKHDDQNTSIRAFMKPAKEVGGDFYDYFYLDNNRLAIIISDVSGKGIPAALFMMKSKELTKLKLMSGLPLAEAVKEANDTLNINNEESLFVTSFIGIIDFKKEMINFVNAGHEKPYIVSKGKVIKLEGNANFVLGGIPDVSYVEEAHPFHKGDFIFMFTDGLNESINDKEEEFSYQRIEDTLSNSVDASLEEYLNNMQNGLAEFVGEQEPFDDITMMIVRFNEQKLSLSYDQKDYSIIQDAVNKFEQYFAYLDAERTSKVGIILDELLNNLISYEQKEDLHIDINFLVVEEDLQIEIISNGNDYDPFKNNKEKYLKDYSDDIEVGGFGVTLVKELSKECKYLYKNDHAYTIIKL